MPYASAKQSRYMHAKHPKIAAKMDADIKRTKQRAINATSKKRK